MPQPVVTAVDILEDQIMAALAVLDPIGNAHWDVAPAGTVAALADGLTRVYVAQSQDAGGAQARLLNSAGWAGLVLVRCMSRDKAVARFGAVLAYAAIATLASPAGYQITTKYDRQIPIPVADRIYTSAAQWAITIRRAA